MKRELEHIEIPDEHEARERTWQLVSSAFLDRAPTPKRPTRRLVPVLVAVAAGAIVAAAISPPGRAVFHAIRETVGVEKAQPALFSLPTSGRLLVASDAGVWVVQADGSKRRLGSYASAAWSPNGLFVATTRHNGLYALTPAGKERWSLARPSVHSPRWIGSRTDTRIAYTSRDVLRVVAGDGRGDDSLGSAPDMAHARLAWRPGTHSLAYALPEQAMLVVVDVDARGDEVWSRRVPNVRKLEWSRDGTRLLVLTSKELRVYDEHGRLVQHRGAGLGVHDTDAAFLPGTHRVALIRVRGTRSDVLLFPGGPLLFHANGELRGLTWAPDGKWLLVGWPAADQLVFLRVTSGGGTRRITAVSNISGQFRSQSFPRVEGWAP
jgi:hypothetical protein